MWDTIAQIGISIFGVAAIIFVARKNKWGFALGLTSQPFWWITAIINHQWGVVLLNVAYTLSWGYGLYQWFWKKEKKEERINFSPDKGR